ncbi:MAG: hypothetical protein J1F11_09600 [Oscillospiraceae bacterium]|nr:hypothetical protein [Oscillospiraceae bacterium]
MLLKNFFNKPINKNKGDINNKDIIPHLSFDLIQDEQELKIENTGKELLEVDKEMTYIPFCRNVDLNP